MGAHAKNLVYLTEDETKRLRRYIVQAGRESVIRDTRIGAHTFDALREFGGRMRPGTYAKVMEALVAWESARAAS